MVGLGLAAGAALVGTGVAQAAPVSCVSPPSENDIQVADTASCGAKATDGGVVHSWATDTGTAVGTANGPGSANTVATGFGTALAASNSGGNAYALALGGGIALSGAEQGATTLAVAGWGSGATANSLGVDCTGALSLAVNLQTGQFCAMR
ncbi:hypothetical protein G4H71_14845 [Rhodococcus triatomae]|nr:DUF6764 family protein [Rhodococcus triatomae]QNG21471.1 hypothetical protein G4H72_15530 [Rhodococcus triatomae]QNG25788.1 hypothetical protein G4H71_14845 [Rhodococcus triatomae]